MSDACFLLFKYFCEFEAQRLLRIKSPSQLQLVSSCFVVPTAQNVYIGSSVNSLASVIFDAIVGHDTVFIML